MKKNQFAELVAFIEESQSTIFGYGGISSSSARDATSLHERIEKIYFPSSIFIYNSVFLIYFVEDNLSYIILSPALYMQYQLSTQKWTIRKGHFPLRILHLEFVWPWKRINYYLFSTLFEYYILLYLYIVCVYW